MTLTARGQVTLGGVQFTSDPAVYEPFNWPKRVSVHPGIGGSLTIQDFGRFAKDLTVHLASGAQQFMEQTVVSGLDVLYATKGATYTLTDWMQNQFSVFIHDFRPVPTFIGTLYTYDMTLRVLSITKLRGTTYNGS